MKYYVDQDKSKYAKKKKSIEIKMNLKDIIRKKNQDSQNIFKDLIQQD